MDGLKRLGPEGAPTGEGESPELGQLAGDAFEHLPVAVALGLLREGACEPELLYGNGAFARLFGGRLPSVLPSHLGDLTAQARSALEQRRAAGRFTAGEAFSETLTLTVPEGGTALLSCQWVPLSLTSVEGRYWSATLSVQAPESRNEGALHSSADRLAAIFEYSPVDICLKDAQGRYLQVSKRFEELYGVTNEQVRGKLPIDMGVDPVWAEQVTCADRTVAETCKPLAYEETIPLHQGAVEGFTVKFPLIDATGELQGIGTICTDITERKEAERALARSEREAARSKALLSEAIESMTDGFVWFDSEGRLVLCNQKYCDLYPKLAGELTAGAAYSDLMKIAFDRDQFTVLAGSEEVNGDAAVAHIFRKHPTFRTKTSEGRWIEARNHPLETGGFIGIRFDVTEQVAAEDALKESEQRFKDFAQSGPGGFWEMDESLRLSSFLDVQTEAGRSRPTAGEATGRTLWGLFAADVVGDQYWRRLRRDLEGRRPIKDLRAAFVSDDGERFYWRINGKPYYDRTGRFRGYRGVAEDESAEIKARQRAEAAEERLIDAIESISGGFALFDSEDRLVLCNQTYRSRAFDQGRHIYPGATFEEIARVNAGEGCIMGLAGEDEKEDWVRRRLRAHQAADGNFEITWNDGRVYQMTERRTHDGGVASVSTDITELKRARELAEQANQAKTRFLAAASHDLRQPLHAIELFVAALEATVSDEETHSIIGDLREASNAAGRLLNAMQDVSELESGKLEGRFMQFPVQQLLDRMVRVYGPQARERGLELKMVPSSQVVFSDPNLLERILGNLLSNAVRYTPSGRVLLGCRRRRDKLRIEVWDTGLGIPEGEKQRIFEEFHQLDNPARERQRGIGLGLSIVRRLANILGHEIFLHSVRGQGSVFAVQLDQTGKSVDLSRRGAGRRRASMKSNATVLVIDDDRQVRKGMIRALESWGCRVEAAGDYDTAADIVTAAPDAFDLIIADYRLPAACNGVRAAGRLRVLCKRMVPVLIVTADQGEEEMREITGQGFPALQKPVDPEALALAVSSLLEDFSVSEPEVS
ncbi:PAS domain-containing hybrid sensor histidine kinase/response regulator [Pelagibius marinus]|uniref:PAS domain-containing hybrid sensor histidine kinase/response regulator n=1 Tax=Pelagibius marinus TaxID=2762760 RepID=UPI001872C224|nr:PAS-domain containing protein [Pelagibius marinus]